MKCSLLTLSCALDGELSPERQADLEAHLVTCERCRTGMRYLREETERIAQLARVTIPPSTATALLERARVVAPAAPAGEAGAKPDRAAPPPPAAILDLPSPPPTGAIGMAAPAPDPELWGPTRSAADEDESGSAGGIAVDGAPDDGAGEYQPQGVLDETELEPAPALEQPSLEFTSDPVAGEDSAGPDLIEDALAGPELDAVDRAGDLDPAPKEDEGPSEVGTVEAGPGAPDLDTAVRAGGGPLGEATAAAGWADSELAEAELEATDVEASAETFDLEAEPPVEPDPPPSAPQGEIPPPAEWTTTAPDAGPPHRPMENPWSGQGTDPVGDPGQGPWQRSWTPPAEALPVWSPGAAPGGWPDEVEEPAPGAADAGDRDEVMEVALEESANLRDEPPRAEPDSASTSPPAGPVWIPPPPARAAVEGWQPKSDLLDIPAATPEARPELDRPGDPAPPSRPPAMAPRRPADTVVPRQAERPAGGAQRIPPPHRPEPGAARGGRPAPPPRAWTRTATIAIGALAVFLVGWALTHHSTPTPPAHTTVQTTPTPSGGGTPSSSPSTAPTVSLTGTSSFGGTGSGYQVQSARYGLHQNGTQLWVVFQLVHGTGAPKVTTGFDGPTTLYVEMTGVASGAAVGQPPSGELVTSIQPGTVPGFSGAVYVIKLSRAAQVSGSLLAGSDTGSSGERVVLQLQ